MAGGVARPGKIGGQSRAKRGNRGVGGNGRAGLSPPFPPSPAWPGWPGWWSFIQSSDLIWFPTTSDKVVCSLAAPPSGQACAVTTIPEETDGWLARGRLY